ncbi:MAG: hypothetical protein HC800_25250 [Phormidesmis sp. RL_2_1]|nr:hypothetical protein [Phormidesmis sp. RL_2_1]
MVTVALLALATWLNAPTWRNSVWLGMSLGLAILAKFTALFFVVVSSGLIFAGYAITFLIQKPHKGA